MQATGCVLGAFERAVFHSHAASQTRTGTAFRADSAGTGGGIDGDYKAMAYPGTVKRLGGLCGESRKDGEAGIAGFLQRVFLHTEPRQNSGRPIRHRHQLPERHCLTADDPDETTLRKGGWLYCVARIPELQAGRGHAGTVSRIRCGAGKADVGRSISGHCYHPSGQGAFA